MTASLPETGRLPVWRFIAGLAVLGSLVAVLVLAGLVYVDNFLLDRYMRALAAQPASATLSDAALSGSILARAKQLDLPVRAGDIRITRTDGRPHIRIAKYQVETNLGRLDLSLPEAASR